MFATLTVIWSLVASIFVTLVYTVTGKRSKKAAVDPSLLKDHYWSLEEGKTDQAIYDFTISVDDGVLDDLKNRLSRTRIFESLQGTNFEYGMRSDVLRRFIDHWSNNYDWRRVENELNQLPHFKTTIEGLSIHFIHVKAKKPARNTLPILMVHGWPGSFYEFVKCIPYLEDDFNLVIPSIPGYGFSQAPEKPGCHPGHIARMYNKLMKRIGYSRFVYQGGDYGAVIGNHMASLYPDDVLGLHINIPAISRNPSTLLRLILADFMPNIIYRGTGINEEQKLTLSSLLKFIWREMAYCHIQATKPDTVAYALNDSPAGLAAYIIEKFSTWTNESFISRPDGGLFQKFSMDDLLTNVTIYWVNGNITSSVRLYKELFKDLNNLCIPPIKVPTGLTPGRHELFNLPQSFQEETYTNLIHYNNMIEAGHFLYFECPREATDDLKQFINKLRLVI